MERTNTYYNIYNTIQGRELTHTTISTTLFRGENKHILQYLKKLTLRREQTHTTLFTNNSGERTNTYQDVYKTIQGSDTQYLQNYSGQRNKTYTILIKLFRGENKDIHNIYKTVQGSEPSHTQYLQSYSGERTSTYTIFTKLCRGEN